MKKYNTFTGITIQEVRQMTNEGGRNFLRWIADVNILGTTERGSRSGEFMVIYQRGDEYRTAVLSKADEKNDGSCFFGSIRHYSNHLQGSEPINAGKRHPFLFDVRTERNINTWISETFGVPMAVI